MSISPLSPLNGMDLSAGLSAGDNFKVAWQSPSNIALVKYWGKKEGQLPASPSLSMTLEKAITRTQVNVLADQPEKGLVLLNGTTDHPFLPKMRQFFEWMISQAPVLSKITLSVTTENSFPHSTGIASSASGMSAFALCLISIASAIQGLEADEAGTMSMASFASRMGSGSACRSLYPGFSAWGATPFLSGSSDEFATPISEFVHPEMLLLRDAILVISASQKSLPSTMGHQSMNGHPFFAGRITQAGKNMEDTLAALSANDFEKLGMIAENEALTLHALIMSANPGTILLKPATVEVIHRVQEARKNGLPLFFTLDAGANVHVLYQAGSALAVEKFIMESLQPLCENGRVIFDCCGPGPKQLIKVSDIS